MKRTTMEEQLKHFMDNGYVALSGALSPDVVKAINDGMDADEAAHPEEWDPGPRPGHVAVGHGAPAILNRTKSLDCLVHHPNALPLVRAILGEGTQVSCMSFLRREGCLADPPEDLDGGDPTVLSRMWHREDRGCVEGADKNNYYTPAIQIIYYLDDVDETSHCTTLIPESAEKKRQLPKSTKGDFRIDDWETSYVDPNKPRWMDSFGRENPRRIGGVDVLGGAGTAVVFNNANWHCGTIRKTERIRRTVHVRYRHPDPVHSRHAIVDPWESVAHFQSALPRRASIGSM